MIIKDLANFSDKIGMVRNPAAKSDSKINKFIYVV